MPLQQYNQYFGLPRRQDAAGNFFEGMEAAQTQKMNEQTMLHADQKQQWAEAAEGRAVSAEARAEGKDTRDKDTHNAKRLDEETESYFKALDPKSETILDDVSALSIPYMEAASQYGESGKVSAARAGAFVKQAVAIKAMPDGPEKQAKTEQFRSGLDAIQTGWLGRKDKVSGTKIGTRQSVQRGRMKVVQEYTEDGWVDVPGLGGPMDKPDKAMTPEKAFARVSSIKQKMAEFEQKSLVDVGIQAYLKEQGIDVDEGEPLTGDLKEKAFKFYRKEMEYLGQFLPEGVSVDDTEEGPPPAKDKTYATPDDVRAAYQMKEISKEEAKQLLIDLGMAP